MAKSSLRALLVAAAWLVASAAAQAAGLGKLTVLSNLGQPLRAEIDVVAVEKNEMETLAARLSSIDAYLQNNLPYPSPSLGLKLALEKRASGQPYIQVTTVQPVNEPFVDVLVELTWNGGRILRAYTALLDPPAYTPEEQTVAAAPTAAAPAAAPTGAAPEGGPAPTPAPPVQTQLGSEFKPKETPPMETAPAEAAPAAEAAPGAEATPGAQAAAGAEAAPPPAEAMAPKPTAPSAKAAAPTMAAAPPEEAGMPRAAKKTLAEDTYGPVKRGDTLSKIAMQYKPDDVSLEQMLVVLFRNNPDAFVGKNMNRLKTGPVLTLPDPSEAAAVDVREARREVRVQVADWRAYKERIAQAAGTAEPMPEQAGQAAGGKVTGPVAEGGAGIPTQPKEVLKLSKGEAPAGAAAQQRIRSLEEEVAAKDKTIKEQSERVVKLEKTIKDMQALLDIKSKQGADLQKPAMTPPGAAPAPAKPAMPTMPAPPPMTAQGTKPGTAMPTPPAAPEMPGKPQAMPAPPATAPLPAPAPAPSAGPMPAPATGPMMAQSAPAVAPQAAQAKPKPAAPKKPRVVVAPPSAGLLDQLLAEPLYLGGGAVALVLLGFLGFRAIRRRRGEADDGYVAAEKKNSEIEPPLTRTDTSGSMVAAARAAAPAAQVTEEVDPLAEAEIYLAYGRDSQAEEILKEAVSSNPRRYEIHVKLLEIYAKRKDVASFEPIAREMQAGTGGQGPLWAQAVRLGYQVDPQNPRYLAGKPSGEEAAAPQGATGVPALDEKLDFNIGLDDADVGTKTDIDLTRLGGAGGGTTTDIDLSSLGAPAEQTATDIDLSTISGVPERTVQVPDVDFDIEAPPADGTASGGVDFDFDLNALGAPPAAPDPTKTQIMTKAMTQTVADIGEPGMGTIEFDLSNVSLDTSDIGKKEPRLDLGAPAGTMPEIDLSSINLDLGGGPPTGGGGETPKDDRWYDVQTKFDLAKAYQEMGDREGAREILREVIAEGDDEQKAAAQRVLETLT